MRKKHESERKLLRVGPNAPFPFVEAYKSLRTNLEFLSGATDCRMILLTSSVPSEGKSNVALNLAITLASGGKTVLLVDCDLRKGHLSRYFRIPRKHAGVSSLLATQCPLEKALVYDKSTRLTILPSGPLPPNPAEILSTPRTESLFAELRKAFDYVIIDTPPVSVVTDAAALSRVADGVILVVRPDITTIQGAQLSKKNLESVNARILGVVMNGYDSKKSTKKDGYYYSYSYDYYEDEMESEGRSI